MHAACKLPLPGLCPDIPLSNLRLMLCKTTSGMDVTYHKYRHRRPIPTPHNHANGAPSSQ